MNELKKNCVCRQLKKDGDCYQKISLSYDCYTELQMGYGWLAAMGEGCAQVNIAYCPFCGRKFK